MIPNKKECKRHRWFVEQGPRYGKNDNDDFVVTTILRCSRCEKIEVRSIAISKNK